MNFAAIVLAAGAGKRMGGPKALLSAQGVTFVARVVATASAAGCQPVLVVLGHEFDRVAHAVPTHPSVRIVRNPAPERGQLSSLQAGLAAVEPAIDGALAWPVDQPFVREETVRAILASAAAHPTCIVVPVHDGHGGHPTFFPRLFFAELGALPAEGSARALLDAHRPEVLRIDVDDPGVCRDVDTPADYAAAVDRGRGPAATF